MSSVPERPDDDGLDPIRLRCWTQVLGSDALLVVKHLTPDELHALTLLGWAKIAGGQSRETLHRAAAVLKSGLARLSAEGTR